MPSEEPHFLVNPYDDPVVVKINGKASFLNSNPMKELFDQLTEQGKARFIIDFQKCSGMDSTFLGILAGLGIKMMKLNPKGSVVLCRLDQPQPRAGAQSWPAPPPDTRRW
jgi:anti-sigma B factor antagonist